MPSKRTFQRPTISLTNYRDYSCKNKHNWTSDVGYEQCPECGTDNILWSDFLTTKQLKERGKVHSFKKFYGTKRRIESENTKAKTGKSEALSSEQKLFYIDIPPELIRRIAKRYTGGHKKYGLAHTNLNWRIGIDDHMYVLDRFNHMVEHMLNFMEDGNDKDDNLAAIAWSCGFLMEVERLAPEVLKEILGQCKLFGKTAKAYQDKLKAKVKK